MERIGFFYPPDGGRRVVRASRGCTRRSLMPQSDRPQIMGSVLIRKPAIDPRYAQFRLCIRESRIHQRGVYAGEPIPARRKVIEYTGERISRRETKRRGDGPVTYLFTLDDYWTLDGAFGGSGAEIINHSCDPNLRSMNFK